MPTKRCCCECYTYLDEFVRDTSDAAELEPDWESCGDWADWELDSGYLKSVTNGSPIVLKHMVGNPYGILEGKWSVAAGHVYLVHVFYGSFETPCGSPDFTVRFEWLTDLTVNVQILQAGNPTPINEQEMSSPTDEVEWHVCVGKGAIQAGIQSSVTDVFGCGTPANYWFAIESEDGVTQWDWVRYTDHFEHNRTCPRCSRRCFGDFGKAIAGFHIEVTGIENGLCGCSDLSFDVYLPDDTNPCLDQLTYYVGYTDDPPTSRVGGPHDCDEAASDVIVSVTCDAGGIGWSMTLDLDDTAQGEAQWNKSWALGTNPIDIREDDGLTPVDVGDGVSCVFDNAVVTFTPYIIDGCCEDVSELATIEAIDGIKRQLTRRPGIRVSELPYAEHDQLINQLRQEAISKDRGLGDTCSRLLKAKHPLSHQIRRWLKVYSCSGGQAVKATNRQFPYDSQK